MNTADDKLLTADDVADLMRVTRAWIYAEWGICFAPPESGGA